MNVSPKTHFHTPAEREAIAAAAFPQADSVKNIEKKYPPRPVGINVFRVPPSPTGSVHIGTIYAALINERAAHITQPKGIFFLRIEDTDKNREVDNGVAAIVQSLKNFGIHYDEGPTENSDDHGTYGPYLQSKRLDIYHAYAAELIRQGRAYISIADEAALTAIRTSQEASKLRPGYYGEWAVDRKISAADILAALAAKKPYTLRLFSTGNHEQSKPFTDLIKGAIHYTQNDQDVVLLKSDGYPTYHFAHVIDDHLMGTTHVTRGDEWLSSLPIHLELFAAFGWQAPAYGHFAPILKTDQGNRRKLSKRKDPEAAVSYFIERGYPVRAVLEYLLNIANSAFEPWRQANPQAPFETFPFTLEKMSKSGALFDMRKLDDTSKNIIGAYATDEVAGLAMAWAETYDKPLANILQADPVYTSAVFGIERGGVSTRKDLACFSDIRAEMGYMFDELFTGEVPASLPAGAAEWCGIYADRCEKSWGWATKDEWFAAFKEYAAEYYKGPVKDAAMSLRLALTGKTKAPDMFAMMMVLGQKRVIGRLRAAAQKWPRA
jgi:glutamyl-tRNA synthetase